MGKYKKGFNWKAREVVQTDIDNSSTAKVYGTTTENVPNLNLMCFVRLKSFSLIASFIFLLQIKIDDGFILRDNYDECNALVIPSEKRRTKTRNDTVTVKRILSKTQRKRLQKIVDKKKKKENVSVQN
jgi:hypothetical protein